jgi:hypothetical protein
MDKICLWLSVAVLWFGLVLDALHMLSLKKVRESK